MWPTSHSPDIHRRCSLGLQRVQLSGVRCGSTRLLSLFGWGSAKTAGETRTWPHVYKVGIWATISRLDQQASLRWAFPPEKYLNPIPRVQWPRTHLPLPSSLLLTQGAGDWAKSRKTRNGWPPPSIKTILRMTLLRMTHPTTSTRLLPLRRSSSSTQFPPPGSGCPRASGNTSSSASSVRCYYLPRSAMIKA